MKNTRVSAVLGTLVLLVGCGVDPNSGEGPTETPTVDPASQLPPLGAGVGTLSGAAEPGLVDGPRGMARFNNPVNVVVGPDGNVYVADYDNGVIRVVRADGTTSTLTHQTEFARPFGLAFTPDGTLYVETDSDDVGMRSNDTGTLWRINIQDGRALPVARDLGRPRGLAALSDGRLVLVDNEHHVIRLFDPTTQQATVLAGERDQAGYHEGLGAEARFDRPYDVVVAGDRILVADQNNHRIRAITMQGDVTTWVGTGEAGSHDGTSADATFNHPQGLARDARGNIYVTEMDGYVVRRITSDGRVDTVAGSGRAGFRDGTPAEAQFYGLEGLDVSPDGAFLFIADGNRGGMEDNHRVRRVAMADAPINPSNR